MRRIIRALFEDGILVGKGYWNAGDRSGWDAGWTAYLPAPTYEPETQGWGVRLCAL